MKQLLIATFMLHSHCKLTRGVETDSWLRMVESVIREARVGYPTSSSRLPDFEKSATRLGREGYPTRASWLPDFDKSAT